jgi:hypothetical protein
LINRVGIFIDLLRKEGEIIWFYVKDLNLHVSWHNTTDLVPGEGCPMNYNEIFVAYGFGIVEKPV